MLPLENRTVLITGGTGSIGQILVQRLLSGVLGLPRKITIFSRDETKQHAMRQEYALRQRALSETSAMNPLELLDFRIGDIRDFRSIAAALRDVDVVFNTAALKQVPTCEYFPAQAVLTNILGVDNIVRAIHELRLPIETVVGLSTDKACKPVNVMGMTKAIQERIFTEANLDSPSTRFVCVRYGNVLASRGSVIPVFHEQIRHGGPLTITTAEMTRFLISMTQAVDTLCAALCHARPGEIYVPRIGSARMVDLARVLIGPRPIEIALTGIRPGEKVHEILVSEEECHRTVERGYYYAILPNLPELRDNAPIKAALTNEYSSADELMTLEQLCQLLAENQLLVDDVPAFVDPTSKREAVAA